LEWRLPARFVILSASEGSRSPAREILRWRSG
jgi:hypothetical protein